MYELYVLKAAGSLTQF